MAHRGVLSVSLIVSVTVMSGTSIVILGPQLTIAGVLLIFIAALCWAKPVFYIQALLAVALALPAGFTTTQIFSIQVGEYHLLYTDVLLGIVALRWILGQVSAKRLPPTSSVIARRLTALIAILFIYAVFALFRGLLEYGRFDLSMYDARPMFYYIVILIAFGYLKTQQDLERLTTSFVVGLSLYSLFVISYFLFPAEHPLAAAQEMNTWAFANRIGFSNGNYLIWGIPMAIWLLVDRREGIRVKIWLMLVLSAFFMVTILSMNRTIVVMLVLSIILSHMIDLRFNRGRTSVLPLRLLLIVALGAISIFIVTEQVLPLVLGESSVYTLEIFMRRFDLTSSAAYETHIVPRIVMLHTSLLLILHNPILGYGFGYTFGLPGWPVEVSFVDNSYLTAWIRMGLIGLLSLLGIIVILIQSIYRLMRCISSINSSRVQAFFLSFAGAIIPLLILSLNISWLVTSSAVIPLLITAGAVIRFSAQYKGKTSER